MAQAVDLPQPPYDTCDAEGLGCEYCILVSSENVEMLLLEVC